MQVQSTRGSSSALLSANPRQQDHRLQSVFAEVLESVGRRGYASAEKLESQEPLSGAIESVWNDWFVAQRTGRYATLDDANHLRNEYGKLLVRAHDEGGYAAPQQFLASLSRDDLETVQSIHRLAEPINVSSLTEEGSLNLLLPPAAQVDLNRDGVTQSGVANGLRFPDSNTPAEVASAWDEVTAGMSLSERMMYEFRMVAPVLLSNIHATDNGAYSHTVEIGDPDWRNPRGEPGYSFVRAAEEWLDHLEFIKPQISEQQHQEQTTFWTRFQELLQKYGAK